MSSNNIFNKNYFELFGLEPHYAQDKEKLRQQYLELQSQFHPDKAASQSSYERQFVLQLSTLINDAYQTLRNPVSRAQYLLGLLLRPLQEAGEPYQADEAFLIQQMELRETLAELGESPNPDKIIELKASIQSKISHYEIALDHAFQSIKYQNIVTEYIDEISRLICELQFYLKLEKELKEI